MKKGSQPLAFTENDPQYLHMLNVDNGEWTTYDSDNSDGPQDMFVSHTFDFFWVTFAHSMFRDVKSLFIKIYSFCMLIFVDFECF